MPGATPPPAPRTARTLVTIGALAIGAALLVYQVRAAGLDAIRAHLVQVGLPGFAAILALSFLRLTMRALAWRALIPAQVPARSAIAATIAGDAIGNLTPLSLLASEPAKAIYLGSHVPASRTAGALAAENFFYSVSVASYVVLGTGAMLLAFALPAEVRTAGIAVVAVMGVVLAGAAWMLWRRPSLVGAALAALPSRRLHALADRVREVERQTYGSAGHARASVGLLGACEIAFHALSFLEAWLTVWLLTGNASPLAAFVLDTVNRVVNVIFKPVPMRVGVDEVTAEAVAQAIGFAPAVGTAMALVRKGRVLVWAAVGVGIAAKKLGRRHDRDGLKSEA
jgi:hypothetical protein